MATKTQQKAHAEMVMGLQDLQTEFHRDWVKGSIPGQWDRVPLMYPVRKEKVKITLTLDEDMVKWFRNLGRGYQARMNAILRVYWHGLLSGDIRAHWEAAMAGPREHSMLENALRRQIHDLQASITAGNQVSGAEEMLAELNVALSEIVQAHDEAAG